MSGMTYTSDFCEYWLSLRHSGASHLIGIPTAQVDSYSPSLSFDKPKSEIFRHFSKSMRIFLHARSRWMIPRSERYAY